MARILVIDDDEAIRSVVTLLLSRKGHQVETAQNGRRGMKLVEDGQFDLLLVDIFMPEMDGLETIRLIRAEKPDLPMIVISGSNPSMPDFLDMATKLGAVESIRKPFRPDQLLAAVERGLAARATNGSANPS
jgi:CheY-like chemotaxis protein